MTELLVRASIDYSIQYYSLTNGLKLLARGVCPTLVWAPTSRMTVLAIHNIASSSNVTGHDLAHYRTSQPQYCRFREILYPTSSVTYLIDPDYVISMPSVISY